MSLRRGSIGGAGTVLLALSGLLLLPAPPAAAGDLVFDIAPTESCLAKAAQDGKDDAQATAPDGSFTAQTALQAYRPNACIGLAAQACMAATEGGWSTYGMGGCLSAEADWWDAQLNANYQRAMKRAKQLDLDNEVGKGPLLSAAKALRDMQRAWIAYRDGACAFEYAQWGGGTGGGPAATQCFLHLTATQALALRVSGPGE